MNNGNYWIGRSLEFIEDTVLSSSLFPLTHYVPRGHNWCYDIAHFHGSRELGVVFDVGANTGQTVMRFNQFFRNTTIHAFEPVSQTFDQLVANVDGMVHVKTHQLALGRNPEQRAMSVARDSEQSTLRVGDLAEEDFAETEMVAVSTIDAFCQDQNIQDVGVLKLDAEGWELEVLAGAERMLQENKIKFIYSEIGLVGKASCHTPFEDLHTVMLKNNFGLCGIYHWSRHDRNKRFGRFANALYMNTDR